MYPAPVPVVYQPTSVYTVSMAPMMSHVVPVMPQYPPYYYSNRTARYISVCLSVAIGISTIIVLSTSANNPGSIMNWGSAIISAPSLISSVNVYLGLTSAQVCGALFLFSSCQAVEPKDILNIGSDSTCTTSAGQAAVGFLVLSVLTLLVPLFTFSKLSLSKSIHKYSRLITIAGLVLALAFHTLGLVIWYGTCGKEAASSINGNWSVDNSGMTAVTVRGTMGVSTYWTIVNIVLLLLNAIAGYWAVKEWKVAEPAPASSGHRNDNEASVPMLASAAPLSEH